jgi:farnesyl-diphosphate farnesyltransferase
MNQGPAGCEPVSLDALLLKTSRTFALSIPELPQPTRREVTLAYLLFRVADTLEDATRWTPERRLEQLERYASVLLRQDEREAQRLAGAWAADPPIDHADYTELLAELPRVLEALRELAAPARECVRLHTLRTIDHMSRFVRRADDAGTLELRDVADLRAYCYAVAGIVGEMLTELFLADRPALGAAAPFLRRGAATFGEALQLVNILKDAAFDDGEGRRYLPRGVERSAVLALARADLDEAERYVLELQRAGAPRGIVAFTALPALLARASLDRVERDGPGSKLTRPEVLRAVSDLQARLDHDEPAVPAAAAAGD